MSSSMRRTFADLDLDCPRTSKKHKPNTRTPSFVAQDAATEDLAAGSDKEAADLAEWYRQQRMADSGENQDPTKYLLNPL